MFSLPSVHNTHTISWSNSRPFLLYYTWEADRFADTLLLYSLSCGLNQGVKSLLFLLYPWSSENPSKMPNLKIIGLRLKSVKNIQKITQSMKMVSFQDLKLWKLDCFYVFSKWNVVLIRFFNLLWFFLLKCLNNVFHLNRLKGFFLILIF